MKNIIVVTLLILTSACTATVDNNYSAQSYVKIGAGEVSMGNFEYTPAINGKVDDNEVKNAKYSNAIRVAGGIAEYIKKATEIEFEHAGLMVVEGSNVQVRAEIHELIMKDNVFNVQWGIKINYSLIELDTGKILINKLYETKDSSSALMPTNVNTQISELVSDTVEKFMSDIADRQLFKAN